MKTTCSALIAPQRDYRDTPAASDKMKFVAIADFPESATAPCSLALSLAASSSFSYLPSGKEVTELAFIRCMPSGLFEAIQYVSLKVTFIKSGASREIYFGLKNVI